MPECNSRAQPSSLSKWTGPARDKKTLLPDTVSASWLPPEGGSAQRLSLVQHVRPWALLPHALAWGTNCTASTILHVRYEVDKNRGFCFLQGLWLYVYYRPNGEQNPGLVPHIGRLATNYCHSLELVRASKTLNDWSNNCTLIFAKPCTVENGLGKNVLRQSPSSTVLVYPRHLSTVWIFTIASTSKCCLTNFSANRLTNYFMNRNAQDDIGKKAKTWRTDERELEQKSWLPTENQQRRTFKSTAVWR